MTKIEENSEQLKIKIKSIPHGLIAQDQTLSRGGIVTVNH